MTDRDFVDEDFLDDDDFFEDDDDIEDEPEGDEPSIDPRLVDDVRGAVSRLEGKIGRRLTQAELQEAVGGALVAVQRGGGPLDVAEAIDATMPKSLLELSPEEHRAWARERADDVFAQANPQKELDRPLDIMNNAEDHLEYARQLYNGVRFEDHRDSDGGDS